MRFTFTSVERNSAHASLKAAPSGAAFFFAMMLPMNCVCRFVLAVVLCCASAAIAQAPLDLPAADRAAIRTAIEGQMAAFRRDDGAAAFGFATPNIQSMFGDPDNFLAMVRRGYAAVYRPRSVEFAELVGEAERPVQLVHVVGPDGETALAAYEMARLDGRWRINGCVLLPSPQKST